MSTDARSTQTADQTAPFRLRGGTFTLMVLQVLDPDDPAFFDRLADKLGQAPSFFRKAPLVIDLKAVPERGRLDLARLVERLRAHELAPVGVQNAAEAHERAATAAGLCVFAAWRSGRQRPERPLDAAAAGQAPEASPDEPEAARAATPSMLVTTPVRSGARVYARGGDLVIAAAVSAGAEVIADGHVHVYGPLRGRALAGAGGDDDARIFCRDLQAELLSIGGTWRVREDIDEALVGRPVQAFLREGALVVEAIG